MPKVVIVGAGISGLALAYRLVKADPGCEVVVLEKQARPGGTVWTEERDGFRFEIGPNGFLDTKPTTLALCRDAGLGDRLVPASEAAGRNRYLLLNDKLKRLPAGLGEFLRTDLLTWRGKLSLLAERLRPGRNAAGDESIDAFARRRAGREAAALFADALVTGIHAGDPKLLSLPATFPRLAAMEREHASVLKGFARAARQRRKEAAARGEPAPKPGRMWAFREGMRLLIERLAAGLPQLPQLGISVRRVERIAGNSPHDRAAWRVRGDGSENWNADAIVLTCPAFEQAGMLAELDAELADRVSRIAYNRVAVVALGYRRADVPRDLNGFGYIAPQRLRGDLLGIQWCSSIFPDRAPGDAVLMRAMCGGWNRPDVVGWDDARLLSAVRAQLSLTMGIHAAPAFHAIVRWDRAIPQYHMGHLERVAWIEHRLAQHPGLFLGGNAYHGVALNDCTERAEVLARQITGYLGSLSAP